MSKLVALLLDRFEDGRDNPLVWLCGAWATEGTQIPFRMSLRCCVPRPRGAPGFVDGTEIGVIDSAEMLQFARVNGDFCVLKAKMGCSGGG